MCAIIFADYRGTLKVADSEGKEEEHYITLDSIIVFATGMAEEPPLGFSPKPSLLFQEGTTFPSANTCANHLRLPIKKDDI